jgi:hypothetical protein
MVCWIQTHIQRKACRKIRIRIRHKRVGSKFQISVRIRIRLSKTWKYRTVLFSSLSFTYLTEARTGTV